MKTMQIEDDVYGFIAAHTREIGESASSILRRLLGISGPLEPVVATTVSARHELTALLEDPLFTRSTTAVSRMLRIFQEAYEQHPEEFSRVLKIGGRTRAYFARSEAEILKSSQSTQPQQIDGTGYWVMTNSPTPMKREMVRTVLRELGYSTAAVDAAAKVIQ